MKQVFDGVLNASGVSTNANIPPFLFMKVPNDEHSLLFHWAGICLKYFLLLIFGLAIVCLLAMTFGGYNLAVILLTSFGHVLWRLAIVLLCLIATVIIVEPWR